jgi:hypothetical protein
MEPAEDQVVKVSQEVFALMKRYKDGYHVSTVIVTAGNAIKILGGIVAGIIALVSIIAASHSSAAVAVGGILVAIAYGLLFYLSGMLIGALGQILKATLDTAVNTSPSLTEIQRARIMSIDQNRNMRFIMT